MNIRILVIVCIALLSLNLWGQDFSSIPKKYKIHRVKVGGNVDDKEGWLETKGDLVFKPNRLATLSFLNTPKIKSVFDIKFSTVTKLESEYPEFISYMMTGSAIVPNAPNEEFSSSIQVLKENFSGVIFFYFSGSDKMMYFLISNNDKN